MFRLTTILVFIIFSSNCFGQILIRDCRNIKSANYSNSLSLLHEDWADEVKYLQFCDVSGTERFMGGYLNDQIVIGNYYLIETVSPVWLALPKNQREGNRYYLMTNCITNCELRHLVEVDSAVLRTKIPIDKYEQYYLANLTEVVSCIENSSCLKDIVRNVSFFRALLNRWRSDLSQIAASDNVDVIEIDLGVSDNGRVEFYISTTDGHWLLLFDRDLSSRKLLGLNRIDY